MPTEMTRIEQPTEAERTLINALTPMERKAALVSAAASKTEQAVSSARAHLAQWFKVKPIPAPTGAKRPWTNPVSTAKSGNAVIVYGDGRAYLGERVRHRNTASKMETWVDAFTLGYDTPCPAPENWRDYMIEEMERPL